MRRPYIKCGASPFLLSKNDSVKALQIFYLHVASLVQGRICCLLTFKPISTETMLAGTRSL